MTVETNFGSLVKYQKHNFKEKYHLGKIHRNVSLFLEQSKSFGVSYSKKQK